MFHPNIISPEKTCFKFESPYVHTNGQTAQYVDLFSPGTVAVTTSKCNNFYQSNNRVHLCLKKNPTTRPSCRWMDDPVENFPEF